MLLKLIDIEQESESEFLLTFNNSAQKKINLKDVLKRIDSGNWDGKKGYGFYEDIEVRDADVSAFHLDCYGAIKWSFGEYSMSSEELIEASTVIHEADVTNIPSILSSILCMDITDVLAQLGMTTEQFELWRMDPSSDVRISNLMLFALNDTQTFSNLDKLRS